MYAVFIFIPLVSFLTLYVTDAEDIIWVNGKCRYNKNTKPIEYENGLKDGFCSADEFYNSMKQCEACKHSLTNCCENTLDKCYYHKKRCPWIDKLKPVVHITTSPVVKKVSTTGASPKDTSISPEDPSEKNTSKAKCTDTDSAKQCFAEQNKIPISTKPPNKGIKPTPCSTAEPQTDASHNDHMEEETNKSVNDRVILVSIIVFVLIVTGVGLGWRYRKAIRRFGRIVIQRFRNWNNRNAPY